MPSTAPTGVPPWPDRPEGDNDTRRDRRWPATTITLIAGLFVLVVATAWIWSHGVRGEPIDDVLPG